MTGPGATGADATGADATSTAATGAASIARVVRVEVQRVEEVPLARPMALAWAPGEVRTAESFTIVRAHDDAGHVGVGEGGRGRALRDAAAALMGMAVDDHAGRAAVLAGHGPAFGLDTAVWDLAGRALGRPLAALWATPGRSVPSGLRAYAAVVELGTIAQRADDARRFADEGFSGLKLRLHHGDEADDLAMAAAVRAAVGDRLVLMADANQGRAAQRDTPVRWTFERARRTARALADLGFAWLEEPLAIDDAEGLARLRAEVGAGIAIAGGERNVTAASLAAMVAAGAYDIVQPDGVVLGSIAELRAAVPGTQADVAAPQVVFHHGGGGVAAVAHLHLAAAIGAPWFEVIRDRPGEVPWPAQRVPLPPVGIGSDGVVAVPTGAGLGVLLDDELLERHTTARTVIE